MRYIETKRVKRALDAAGFVPVSRASPHRGYRAPTGQRITLPLNHPRTAIPLIKRALSRIGFSWEALGL